MNKAINWIYLSYPLSPNLSGYGDGNRIIINQLSSIINGDTSNNTEISMPIHFGTHIDFPNHFVNKGKTIDDYSASFFLFDNISIINLEYIDKIEDYIIQKEHFFDNLNNCSDDTELLIIKTGFCYKRDLEEYWKYGYGIGLGVAKLLKTRFPLLRAIGFDLISLNSYQQRAIGRESHKEFLVDNNILIIEDMNLSILNKETTISDVIISPLYVTGAEGAPVTVFASILV